MKIATRTAVRIAIVQQPNFTYSLDAHYRVCLRYGAGAYNAVAAALNDGIKMVFRPTSARSSAFMQQLRARASGPVDGPVEASGIVRTFRLYSAGGAAPATAVTGP